MQSINSRYHRIMFRAMSVLLLMAATWAVSGAQDVELSTQEVLPSGARQTELHHLLKHDCGACHGMSLQGGLGSPLTPEILRDKPDESLIATILYGRSGTPMPPWKAHLNEQEARWLVQQLRKGVKP